MIETIFAVVVLYVLIDFAMTIRSRRRADRVIRRVLEG